MGVASPKNKDGFLQSDNQGKIEILNRRFSSVFTREDDTSTADKGQSLYTAMSDIVINRNGVMKILKELNPHKATGPDDLPSRILKLGAGELAPALVKLYQYSIDTGEVHKNGGVPT